MMTIQNMVRQHREFQSWLDDAERLWLYAQSAVSKHQALDISLAKAEVQGEILETGSLSWYGQRKRGTKPNSRLRWLFLATGEAKARAEDDLARM